MSYTLQLGVGRGLATPVPDAYTNRSTLDCAETIRIDFTVYNQGIYLTILRNTPGGGVDDIGTEVHYGPGFYSIERLAGRLKVRNAVAGKAAAIGLEALTAQDLPPSS